MGELSTGVVVGGRYRIAQAIGEGGVGAVYAAHDTELGKEVALKWLKPELNQHETLRPRFEREAKLLSGLSHPGVVLVTDYGTHDEGAYLVMERLHGHTLSQRLRAGPMGEPEARQILDALLDTLAAVHAANVMHRDLKPGNIFLEKTADGVAVKILDFGFARHISGTADALQRQEPKLTKGHTAFGTPSYMAPEQATVGEMDARTDVYSIGIILFEMLSGAPPFRGEVPDLLRMHMVAPVPQLQDLLGEGARVAPELQAFLERALAKLSKDRFDDAAAMLQALRALPARCVERPGDPPAAPAPRAERPDGTVEMELEPLETEPPPASGASLPPPVPGGGSRKPRAGKASGSRVPAPPPPTKKGSRVPAPPAPGERSRAPAPPKKAASRVPAPPAKPPKKAAKPAAGPAPQPATEPADSPAPKPAAQPAQPARPIAGAPALPAAEPLIDAAVEANTLRATIEARIQAKPPASELARLHFELASLLEQQGDDDALVCQHYREAAKRNPSHLPSVAGARAALQRTGKHLDALELLDRECALHPDTRRRASLMWEKGQLIERTGGKPMDALRAYTRGLELDGGHIDLLRAAARLQRALKQWDKLDATLDALSSRTAGDAGYRAAIIGERARLADNRGGDPARASELYTTALSLDPDLPGAIEALKRESHARGQWQRLIEALEQEAARATSGQIIAAAQASIAAIHIERLGALAPAIQALQAALTHTPQDVTLWLRLAELHGRAQQHDEQAECLTQAVNQTGDPATRAALLLRLAKVHEGALGAPDAAVECLRAALEVAPNHGAAQEALAALHLRSGDHAGLRALLEAAVQTEHEPNARASYHYRLAQLLEQRLGEPDVAAEHLRTCLSIVPSHDAAIRGLDRILGAQGKVDALVQVYEQAVEAAPTTEAAVSHLMRMGSLREGPLSDPGGAGHCYRRVLERDPKHHEAMYSLQRVAARAGDAAAWLEAMDMELSALPPGPRRNALQVQSARLLSDALDDPEAAIPRLQEVLRNDAAHGEARRLLSERYRQLGRWDALLEAEQSRLSTEKAPDARAAIELRLVGIAEEELGDPAGAIKHARAALKERADLQPAHVALCRLLRATGDWKGLVDALRARLSATDAPLARAHVAHELGVLLEEQLGDTAGAIKAHGEALSAVPGFRPSADARLRLLSATGKHRELLAACGEEADNSGDSATALDARVRAAGVQLDLLNDAKGAAATYEAVFAQSPRLPSALHALQTLYAELGEHDKLVRVYEALASSLTDGESRVAVLRDLSRLVDEPGAVLAQMAHLAPKDHDALQGLSRLTAGEEPKRHASCERALAALEEDRGLGATHLVRAGTALNERDPAGALEAFEQALALDPASMAAARGVTRAARALSDPDAMTRAARAEVDVVGQPEVAVGLYLEAAALRAGQGDVAGAADDAARALELDPSDARAAEYAGAFLLSLGQVERLCDLLSRAAQSGSRGAALFTEVATLRAERIGDIPEAIACLRRALSSQRDHLPALTRLPELLQRTGDWAKAADAHEQLLAHTDDPALRLETRLAVARLATGPLSDYARASEQLHQILKEAPDNREALELKVQLLLAQGDAKQALEVTESLLEFANSPEERANTLLDVAVARQRCGDVEGAARALGQAVEIQGGDGAAAAAYRRLIGGPTTWEGYVAALEGNLTRLHDPGERARAMIAIAEAQSQGMRAPKRALATLEAGARDFPDDDSLWLAYARQLIRADHATDAVAVYQRLITRCPQEAELWRGLGDGQAALGNTQERIHSALPLLLLDAASSEHLVELRGRTPAPMLSAGSMDDAVLARVDREELRASPATRLARTMTDIFARTHGLDLKTYGLGKRDRLGPESGHPLRAVLDELAAPLGLGELDLYVFSQEIDGLPDVHAGLEEPNAVMVHRRIADSGTSVQRFELGRTLFCIAHGLAGAVAVPPQRVLALMAGAIRRQRPDYSLEGFDDAALDEAAKAVGKALPWLGKHAVDDVAAAFADTGVDLRAWQRALRRVSARAGLLLCDDLLAALERMRGSADWSPFEDPAAVDLLSFWASDTAVAHRKR